MSRKMISSSPVHYHLIQWLSCVAAILNLIMTIRNEHPFNHFLCWAKFKRLLSNAGFFPSFSVLWQRIFEHWLKCSLTDKMWCNFSFCWNTKGEGPGGVQTTNSYFYFESFSSKNVVFWPDMTDGWLHRPIWEVVHKYWLERGHALSKSTWQMIGWTICLNSANYINKPYDVAAEDYKQSKYVNQTFVKGSRGKSENIFFIERVHQCCSLLLFHKYKNTLVFWHNWCLSNLWANFFRSHRCCFQMDSGCGPVCIFWRLYL